MVGGFLGIQRDRLREQALGDFVAAGLAREHAEQVVAVRMPGVDGEDFAIERFGFLNSARAVARPRSGKQVQNAVNRGSKRVRILFGGDASLRSIHLSSTSLRGVGSET